MARDKYQKLQETDLCKFNFFVCCPGAERECGRCGWNPLVTEARKRRMRARMQRRRRCFVWQWRSL